MGKSVQSIARHKRPITGRQKQMNSNEARFLETTKNRGQRLPEAFPKNQSTALLFSVLLVSIALCEPVFSAQVPGDLDQVRSEIPYREGKVILVSDFQERVSKTRYRAQGHVLITYQDIVMSGDVAEYDTETREGFTEGQTRFSQKQQWLVCFRAEFNLSTQTAVFYDASGYTDQQFSITGRTIRKTGPDTYTVESGAITACQQKVPKWSFGASSATIRVDRTARLHTMLFKIKGIPVFYSPYLIVPMEKKKRSSGFVPFHYGKSNSKGRVFSEGYYQTLGKSADVTVHGDYFSLRGLALGAIFRARPNPVTRFNLQTYGIHDKLGQSGVQLMVDGESLLKDDWRAVARVNISSNFSFRQAFAENFRAATVAQEHATAFLTRNHNSFSTNIAFERQEVLFPVRSLVIRKLPSLEFLSLGTPLGNSPFIFSLRTSMDGVSRQDSTMETQGLTQRLDVFPSLSVRIPAFKGFSIMPSLGVRETYYGAQISQDSPNQIVNNGWHRQYTDLTVELRMPSLERDFASSWLGNFQHRIEPLVTYRWIHGIKDLMETIRFDEQDAIADTNELEYGIINRFFRNQAVGENLLAKREFMSFALFQKYYMDPTFGGSFRPGQSNSFYPLDTVTGLYQTGIARNFSPLSAVFKFSPRNAIYNEFRADYDTKLQRWRNEGLSTVWAQGKIRLAGTYFLTQATEPGILSTNHVQGRIDFGSLNRGLSTSVTVSYNLRTSQLLNSQTRLNYLWDCCGVSAEFTQFDLGLRTESRISFSFSLKGIGSLGNLKGPESPF
jgi:LPS-assembly protein